MKKFLALLLGTSMLLAGCGGGETSSASGGTSSASSAGESASGTASEAVSSAPAEPTDVMDLSGAKAAFAEVKAIYEGAASAEELPSAEIVTSMGSIKIRFYPEYAPKAVENFLTHAENGYYDGLTFHRVVQDFMIQGGDPKGNGTGGESIWGTPFEDEPSDYLHHFPGAISMANSGVDTNGSQFFIVQNKTPLAASMWEMNLMGLYHNKIGPMGNDVIDQYIQEGKSEEEIQALVEGLYAELEAKYAGFAEDFAPVEEMYLSLGGTPSLDYKHTVFGYVYEGMEVVDAIAAVETEVNESGEDSKPVEDILIERIVVTQPGA